MDPESRAQTVAAQQQPLDNTIKQGNDQGRTEDGHDDDGPEIPLDVVERMLALCYSRVLFSAPMRRISRFMLTRRQVRFLRTRAHHCHPLVRIGQNGLTEAVVDELDTTLNAHELVKIRIAGADRSQRDAWLATLCERTGAETVQRIGHTASLFRRNPEQPKIDLP